MKRASKTRTKNEILEDLFISLEQLTNRFPLEGFAQNGKCICIQYEDKTNCRHLEAKRAIDQARTERGE